MGGAYAWVFAGVICLLAGGYIVTGGAMTGLVLFAIGWALIIFGIRKVVTFKKEDSDASR